MGVNMSIPAAYDECLSQTEQLEWLYKNKENLLTAGANIKITRSGDTVIISAEGEGFSPTVNVEVIPGGHRVTITDGEGAHVFDVMDGQDGTDGTDGSDGTSVIFATQSITGGTRVTLTDGDHSSSFDVMNGTDGEDITITDVTVISAGTQVTFSDDTVIVIPNGLTGPVGPSGQNGRNVFIKYADAQPTQDSDMKDIPSAFMGVYSGTATTAPSTYTDYLWYQIKGSKGDSGNPGPAGVSPTLSAEPISGGHRVTMTDAQGTTTFDVMDGENAAAATVTVGSTTTGEPGTNASVTNSGTSSDAVLNFVIPRGAKGDTGVGEKGDKGDTGATPAITMSATADATSSVTPSVTVTKTGTDEAPNFALAFSGLKGETGASGSPGQGIPSGGTGNQVLSKVNATDYNTQWKTIGLIPTGGTSGQVLTKTGSSNYQMSWSTPTGRLPDYPYGALVADETGTAVWLGPNNVDPTTDIGKVLTLKNIAESDMPPQIIPQWESAGGGSGGSDYAEMSVSDSARNANYNVNFFNNTAQVYTSAATFTPNMIAIPAKKRTFYRGSQQSITEGYKLDITGSNVYCIISNVSPLAYNLYFDIQAGTNMLIANPDPNGSALEFDDTTCFTGYGICSLEVNVNGQVSYYPAAYTVMKKANSSDTLRINVQNAAAQNLMANEINVRF